MSKLVIDFPNDDFEILPEGIYTVTVDSIIETTAKGERKSPYLAWSFTVVRPEQYAGRKLWLNTSLLPQSIWNLRNILRSFGVKPKGRMEVDYSKLVGLTCKVQVGHEEDNEGNTRAKVIGVDGMNQAANLNLATSVTNESAGKKENNEMFSDEVIYNTNLSAGNKDEVEDISENELP